jgi:hypothetical protein
MKLKYFVLLLLSLYIVNCTFYIEAQATIRYVSKSGTNTPPYTSWETAATSIQLCINVCVDGDTIYVANGIYKENLVINTAISLIGSSMDSTVIDGRGLEDLTIVFNASGNIENFNIYGRTIGTGYGIYVQTLSTIEVKNCQISETGRGIAAVGLLARGIIMKNLRSGIITAAEPNTTNFVINCIIILESNSSNGISLPGPTGADYYITNNILLFTGANSLGPGISIGAPKKVYIYNNLISGFRYRSINFDTVIDTAFVNYNILAYGGSLHSSGNRIYVNNVVLINNGRSIYQSGSGFINSDYNLFWKNGLDLDGTTYGDSDRVADPMFIKDTIPNPQLDFDYHLQAFSPGIDKGDPNILDLDGTRSDIGVYGGPFGETYTYQDLAPLAPRNLSAFVDSNYILVKWNKNTEADTSFYKVYRDTVTNFTVDSTKLVSSSTDTFYVQPNPHNVSRYVYRITCVDNQGNESLPSNELVVNITSVSTDDYPMTISYYVLYQNYPNPFNPSTKIGYQLKERAYVKLMVYDIKGELVSVLVNKEQTAGYYEAEFSSSSIRDQESSIKSISSGIYLYRIEIIGEGKIPVYTEMKKMILIK